MIIFSSSTCVGAHLFPPCLLACLYQLGPFEQKDLKLSNSALSFSLTRSGNSDARQGKRWEAKNWLGTQSYQVTKKEGRVGEIQRSNVSGFLIEKRFPNLLNSTLKCIYNPRRLEEALKLSLPYFQEHSKADLFFSMLSIIRQGHMFLHKYFGPK